MENNSNTGGLLPSVIALNASLNQRLGTSQEPTMLTPSEQELLRQVADDVEAQLSQSDRLKALLARLHNARKTNHHALPAEEQSEE